jgi:hypothetical protein
MTLMSQELFNLADFCLGKAQAGESATNWGAHLAKALITLAQECERREAKPVPAEERATIDWGDSSGVITGTITGDAGSWKP